MNPSRRIVLFENMLDYLSWSCEFDYQFVEALNNCDFTIPEIRQVLYNRLSQSDVDNAIKEWREEFGEDAESN